MIESKIEELINEVFEKAKTRSASSTKNALSSHIVEEIENETRYLLAKETLIRAYDKFVSKEKPKNSNPRSSTVEYLCKYLGYRNYREYTESKENDSKMSVDIKRDLNVSSQENIGNQKLENKKDEKNNIQLETFHKYHLRKRILIYSLIGILILAIIKLLYVQYSSPFNITFYITKSPGLQLRSDYPILSKKDKASLKFYLPTGIEVKGITQENTIDLIDLTHDFHGEKIKVELLDSFWKLTKDSIVLNRDNITLEITPNDALANITGEVLSHVGGLPIENAIVRFEDIEGTTNRLGLFFLKVPVEKRKPQYELTIFKKDYKVYKKIYIAGSKAQIRLLKHK